MYKIYLFVLALINVTALVSFVISWFYYSKVSDIFESTLKEDSRMYLKLKNVFSLPIFYLQSGLLVIELIYFMIFCILNNTRLSQFLGLGTNKISKQISHDYSNFFLEILFSVIIKVSGLLISLFFIFKSYEELDKFKQLDTRKKDMISYSINYLNILFIAVCSSLLLFMTFYTLKFIHVKKKNSNSISSHGNSSGKIDTKFTAIN
jgi:hypothetical protein